MSYELTPGSIPEIGEEQLQESQPRVRALLVHRYEKVWTEIDNHIKTAQQIGRPPDPRMLEIGLRVLKDEAVLYRLGRLPTAAEADEEEPASVDERLALVMGQLAEVEARRMSTEDAARDYLARQEAKKQDAQVTG